MTANNSLSASSWSVCETQLKHIVEGDTAEFESLPFLRACGIVGAEVPPIASPLGQRYYEARFIRNDMLLLRPSDATVYCTTLLYRRYCNAYMGSITQSEIMRCGPHEGVAVSPVQQGV